MAQRKASQHNQDMAELIWRTHLEQHFLFHLEELYSPKHFSKVTRAVRNEEHFCEAMLAQCLEEMQNHLEREVTLAMAGATDENR